MRARMGEEAGEVGFGGGFGVEAGGAAGAHGGFGGEGFVGGDYGSGGKRGTEVGGVEGAIQTDVTSQRRVRKRASDWERQRPVGRRRAASPQTSRQDGGAPSRYRVVVPLNAG